MVIALVLPSTGWAGVYNPRPADASGDPQDTFVDDDPLFAYASVDIKGGQICVVDNVGGTFDSCSSPVFGEANLVVGLGTTYTLLEGGSLRPGTWRLQAEDSEGLVSGRSEPFTVVACPDCSRELAQATVAEWKQRATSMREGAGLVCTAWSLYGAQDDFRSAITAAHGDLTKLTERADAYEKAPGEDSFLATVVPIGAGFSGLAFPSPGQAIATGEGKAKEILQALLCAVSQMYKDIENDPPDPNFATVEQPSFRPIDPLGSAESDALAESADRQAAFAEASLTAFERYLGAKAANDDAGVQRQSRALGDFSSSLVGEIRRSADRFRDYAVLLETLPDLNHPIVADDDERAKIAGVYERVRADGFTDEEEQELASKGFSADEIELIRARFELDPTVVPVGKTLSDVARDTADLFDAQAAGFDRMAREAAIVAARMNTPPVAALSASPESGPAPLEVTFTDDSQDPDGDQLSVVWDFGDGAIGMGPTATHTYMADGTYTVTVTVCDEYACSAAASSIFVGTPPPNQAPMAADDSFDVESAVRTGLDVRANDVDPDDDPTRIVGFTQAAHGTVECVPDVCAYRSDPDFTGADGFEYTIADGRGGQDTATVSLTVQPRPNGDPITTEDTLSTNEGSPQTIDVLANDSDPDDDQLAVTDSTDGSAGAVECTEGGACTYTPGDGYSGPDGFNYTVSDGRGGSAGGFVSVAVEPGAPPPNAPPTAQDDSLQTAQGDEASLDVLGNDEDPDGDDLVLTGLTGSPPGTVTCQASGRCTYTPQASFSGSTGFDYTVSDGRGASDQGHVDVTVRPTPQGRRPFAAFRAVPLGGVTPLQASFDASDSTDPDDDIAEYIWEFGDGTTGSGRIATHVYDDAGTYVVKLTVVDEEGARDAVAFEYTVQDVEVLDLPYCGDEDEGTATSNCPDYEPAGPTQLFRVRGSGPVAVTFDYIVQLAAFQNELAAIPVDDATGAIGDLSPGEPGYVRAALERARVVFPMASSPSTPDATLTFQGGDYLMFLIVPGSTVEQMKNSGWDGDLSTPPGFFSMDGLNLDIAKHMFAFRHKTNGTTEFAWEDLPGNGGDFDDIIYTVDEHLVPLAALSAAVTADHPTSLAGERNGYRVTASNSGPGPAAVDSVEMTLPEGFRYVPGSTSGDTTSDPGVSGRTLTWQGPFETDIGQAVRIQLKVDVANTPGDYFAEADADAGAFGVTGSGPMAKIVVTRLERPPNAVDDALTTDAGVPGVVNVLVNDSDPDGDPLSVTGSTQGADGSVSCAAGGVCTYSPRAGFSGADQFRYTVGDGRGQTSDGTVRVTVRPPPQAVGDPVGAPPAVVNGCVNFLPGISGPRLGLARLGRRRSEHAAMFKGAKLRTRPGTDRYCIAGGGSLRIGYPNARINKLLNKKQRRALKGRALLILTSSNRYRIKGFAPGSKEKKLRSKLKGERVFKVGKNTWYLVPGGSVRFAFKAQGGVVREVGILNKGLTARKRSTKRFLRGWETPGPL